MTSSNAWAKVFQIAFWVLGLVSSPEREPGELARVICLFKFAAAAGTPD